MSANQSETLYSTVVAWKSQRQITVALSTMTLTETTKELKWIRTLLAELGYTKSGDQTPTALYSDNQSAITSRASNTRLI